MFTDDQTVCVVVVHDEDTAARNGRGRRRLLHQGGGGGQAYDEGKCAASAWGALDVECAPHQLHQLFADAQAEACAAVFAGGRRVPLGEAFEDTVEHARGNPDARVGDRTAERAGICLLRLNTQCDLAESGLVWLDSQNHLALVREFDGIAQQVDEYLTEACRIACHPGRDIRVDIGHQFEVFGAGSDRHQFSDLVNEIMDIEGDRFQFQMASLDLGNVQDTVEQFHEACGRAAESVDVFLLVLRERRFLEQVGHADDRIHRGTDLMAHRGQKLTLRPCSCGRGLMCFHQLDVF